MAQTTARQTELSLTLEGGLKPGLVRLDAHEALSEPFRIVLDVIADESFEILKNIGQNAAVECSLEGEFVRYFNGVIIAGEFLEEIDGAGYCYRLLAAPKSHFHEQGSAFRIFQNKPIRDIIKTVLDKCGITHEFKAKSGTRALPYCVQYGESDFAFVSRLLEEEGLYYYYDHTKTAHKMVICDAPNCHTNLDHPDFSFNPVARSVAVRDSQASAITAAGIFVDRWTERVSSGAEAKVTLRDYDFIDPAKPRETEANDKQAHKDDDIEVYQWPGRYYQESEGKELGSVLLESRRAQRLSFEATSYYPGIIPGFKFTLKKHPIARYNKSYVITRAHTRLTAEQYRSGGSADDAMVTYTSILSTVQFRAPIITPRPFAKGPETAVVTGPASEEIHVDEYGRIKVQFHWDRDGKLDDKSSCWIRVSQTGGLGNIIIPRVGHEVLVDFVNGNPDRPIVVGRVFNKSHMPVYKLPDHKTKALWRTKTYKADQPENLPSKAKRLDTKDPKANELRFDDATGAEEVFLHAQRDMNTRIRSNETHHVGHDVGIDIGQNRTETVGANETITIEADRTETVKGKETVEVVGDRKVTIKSNDKLDVTKNIDVTSSAEITITATKKIILKVGQSSITINPTSVEIKTLQLKMSGSATAELTAPKTDVSGSGILTLKGGMVHIN